MDITKAMEDFSAYASRFPKSFFLKLNSKRIFFQEIVRHWEGHDTTVHVRRSPTNCIHHVGDFWPKQISRDPPFELEWAPISKVLRFPPFQLKPDHPTAINTHPPKYSFLWNISLKYQQYFPLHPKYSLSCYFSTDSTFWWQVNFTKGESMHCRPQSMKRI